MNEMTIPVTIGIIKRYVVASNFIGIQRSDRLSS